MKKFLTLGLGWGTLLWFIGYVLGIVLFMVVPPNMVGWFISPIGIILTLWVLGKYVKGTTLRDYLLIALIWTLIAIFCDYFFLVKVFKPADGYYKLDVYLYYLLTFFIPLTVGWYRTRRAS
jgi:hypothetical protein